MTTQPDKRFGDQLENYQSPAPAQAWQRIEAGLDEKKFNKKIWYQVAAAVTVLVVAAYVLWSDTNPPTVAESTLANQSIPSKVTPAETISPESPITPETEINSTKPAIESRVSSQNKAITSKNAEMQPTEVAVITPNSAQEIITVSEPVIVHVVEQETVTEASQPSQLQGAVYVYSADEVTSRFLKKKKPSAGC